MPLMASAVTVTEDLFLIGIIGDSLFGTVISFCRWAIPKTSATNGIVNWRFAKISGKGDLDNLPFNQLFDLLKIVLIEI